jgi:predicted DsbA family dithiol-disulfide isomerase
LDIPALSIEVYADPVCPWCFIGKRRLDQARALAGGTVTVIWRAYQLNPAMPVDGMERGAYLAAKFGGPDRARQVYEVIRREGLDAGITFAFSRIARTPNTLSAHRLVRFATERGAADALMERLFAGYFLEGRDIGSPEELARIAAEAGLDADAAREFLAGNAFTESVLQEDRMARASGISGVPHFVVAGRYALPGAQSPEVIARAIELARVSEGLARRAGE